MADKSALYPMVAWSDCMDFVKTVSSFSLKAVSYGEVAKKYGLNNPTAKSFTAKVSTCKQFGLITTAGGNTIQLTDTCKRILFPTGEDVTSIMRACFGMAPLYNKLIAAYDGKAIPNQELLANILMSDHKIQKPVKDQAARMFIESAEQLGLIRGGILCFSDAGNDIAPAISNQASNNENADLPEQISITPCLQTQGKVVPTRIPNESDYITQAIPFASGKIARFVIPVDAQKDDLLLLHDMLNVLLKRKFKLDI